MEKQDFRNMKSRKGVEQEANQEGTQARKREAKGKVDKRSTGMN